jgi:hypothetical protein
VFPGKKKSAQNTKTHEEIESQAEFDVERSEWKAGFAITRMNKLKESTDWR